MLHSVAHRGFLRWIAICLRTCLKNCGVRNSLTDWGRFYACGRNRFLAFICRSFRGRWINNGPVVDRQRHGSLFYLKTKSFLTRIFHTSYPGCQHTAGKRRWVTSTGAHCLEARCRQNDTSIGIARGDPKNRLTTLLNCSRAVRPGWDRSLQETARMCPTCTCWQRAVSYRGVIHLCAQQVSTPWITARAHVP